MGTMFSLQPYDLQRYSFPEHATLPGGSPEPSMLFDWPTTDPARQMGLDSEPCHPVATSASFHSREMTAPSKCEIKHLTLRLDSAPRIRYASGWIRNSSYIGIRKT